MGVVMRVRVKNSGDIRARSRVRDRSRVSDRTSDRVRGLGVGLYKGARVG